MDKLNREQLIDLVRRIRLGEGSDEEASNWIMQIEKSVPHPDALDVITRGNWDLSEEQVVDKLLNYKPTILPY